MRMTFVIVGAVFVSMSGVAVANDLSPRCDTRPSKVCAKWAPGSPGTLTGKCIAWKWVRAQCVNSGRESWRWPKRKERVL